MQPPRLVNDFAGLLTVAQRNQLETKLLHYEDSTGNQIAIAIIESLEGADEADYAVRLALKWKVGQKHNNNGILILLSKADRAVSIEVGYGLEAYIPDVTAHRIIQNLMLPHFKKGNYYQGLEAGTDALMQAAAGAYKNQNHKGEPISGGKVLILMVFLIVIFIIIVRNNRMSGGRRGSFADGWLLSQMMRGGRRSGGFSDFSRGRGGFGGFGGGSFGGGGASGRW
jgi:uncharacterized protein